MSTDDLTARVRDHLAHADTLPHGLAIALVSELADEVDRLRADRDECAMQWRDQHAMFGAVRDERDAARAALERVRAERDRWKERWQATVADADAYLAERDTARAELTDDKEGSDVPTP